MIRKMVTALSMARAGDETASDQQSKGHIGKLYYLRTISGGWKCCLADKVLAAEA